MSKLLLVATVLSTIVFASCTQLNADEGSNNIRNQGCYNQIDAHKEANGEPSDRAIFESGARYLLVRIWNEESNGYQTVTDFEYDKLDDVCRITGG